METEAPPCPFEIPGSWHVALEPELEKPYLTQLASFVELERRFSPPIYPPPELVFNALIQTPLDQVKVVIVGQDPYHGPGQAHGLSFSVPIGIPPPPSLQNIFKEIRDDLGIAPPNHGCLIKWAQQGVLLLNATLTVRGGAAKSHYGRGWEAFTDALITQVALKQEPVVFLLWGQSAKEKVTRVQAMRGNTRHLVLTSAHPSPLSVYQGFQGCRHFSQANRFLEKTGLAPIDWSLQP